MRVSYLSIKSVIEFHDFIKLEALILVSFKEVQRAIQNQNHGLFFFEL
jgi:hypothetical protein